MRGLTNQAFESMQGNSGPEGALARKEAAEQKRGGVSYDAKELRTIEAAKTIAETKDHVLTVSIKKLLEQEPGFSNGLSEEVIAEISNTTKYEQNLIKHVYEAIQEKTREATH